jgi:hypothetical protein
VSDQTTLAFALEHRAIVEIVTRLDLETYAKITISHDKQAETTGFLGTVGISLNVNF